MSWVPLNDNCISYTLFILKNINLKNESRGMIINTKRAVQLIHYITASQTHAHLLGVISLILTKYSCCITYVLISMTPFSETVLFQNYTNDTLCPIILKWHSPYDFHKGMQFRTFLQAFLVICLVVLVAEGEKQDTVVSDICDKVR